LNGNDRVVAFFSSPTKGNTGVYYRMKALDILLEGQQNGNCFQLLAIGQEEEEAHTSRSFQAAIAGATE
jgi:hypothetical protein